LAQVVSYRFLITQHAGDGGFAEVEATLAGHFCLAFFPDSSFPLPGVFCAPALFLVGVSLPKEQFLDLDSANG
jgi:hypothetical protein